MKTKLLALTLLAAMFASCSSDDGESIDYNQLNKKWYHVSEKIGGQTFPYDDHEPCGKDYIEFMSSGMGRFVDVWDCNGSTAVIEQDEFSWTRSGKTIIVSIMGYTENATITKLTANTLQVKVMYDWDDDGVDDTVIETYTSTP
jgi:hypothetical protein